MPPQQSFSPEPSVPGPKHGHSSWFYIFWIIALIILIPAAYIAIKFTYFEYQMYQTRQNAQDTLQASNNNYQDIQDVIDQPRSDSQVQQSPQAATHEQPVTKTSITPPPVSKPVEPTASQSVSPSNQTNQEKISNAKKSFQMNLSGGWTLDHQEYLQLDGTVMFTYVGPSSDPSMTPSIIRVSVAPVSNTHFTEYTMNKSPEKEAEEWKAEGLTNAQKTNIAIPGAIKATQVTGTIYGGDVVLMYVWGSAYNFSISGGNGPADNDINTIMQIIGTFKVVQ